MWARRMVAAAAVALVALALLPGGARAGACRDLSPMGLGLAMDCKGYVDFGFCENKQRDNKYCDASCGRCLDDKDQRGIRSLSSSIDWCAKEELNGPVDAVQLSNMTAGQLESLVNAPAPAGAKGVMEDMSAFVLAVRKLRASKKGNGARTAEPEGAARPSGLAHKDLYNLLRDEGVHEAMRGMPMSCLAKSYGLHDFMSILFDNRTLDVPENAKSLASAKAARQLLHGFYQHGCTTDQLVGFLPALAGALEGLDAPGTFTDDKSLLLKLYSAQYSYLGTRVRFTQPTSDGLPSLSHCLSPDGLTLILSARECEGRNCFRGPRSVDRSLPRKAQVGLGDPVPFFSPFWDRARVNHKP